MSTLTHAVTANVARGRGLRLPFGRGKWWFAGGKSAIEIQQSTFVREAKNADGYFVAMTALSAVGGSGCRVGVWKPASLSIAR